MKKKELNDFFQDQIDRINNLTDEELAEMEKQNKEYNEEAGYVD